MADSLLAGFFGHGNPMNALMNDGYADSWRRVGDETPRPRAILAISAHGFVPETGMTIIAAPRTIHDVGAFRANGIRSSTPRPAIPRSRDAFSRCSATIDVALDDRPMLHDKADAS